MSSGSNVLSEYLVALGFSTDQASFTRFVNVLRDASSVVDNEYLEMAKKVIEFEVATVSAFAAVGAAALKIADDVAMSDQEYRLFALHMYTSLPVARELKVALDALGQPLENVMGDPELLRRFSEIVAVERTWEGQLKSADFESQMLKIRDLNQQFTLLGVNLYYLKMLVVSDLTKAFGPEITYVTDKLKEFNIYLETHGPAIAAWLATNLKPILTDVKDVMLAMVPLAEEFAVTFTNLVGTIGGDTSIQGSTFSWNKLAKAIQETTHFLAEFVIYIARSIELLLALTNAVLDLANGDFKGAGKELANAGKLYVQNEMQTVEWQLGGQLGAEKSLGETAINAGLDLANGDYKGAGEELANAGKLYVQNEMQTVDPGVTPGTDTATPSSLGSILKAGAPTIVKGSILDKVKSAITSTAASLHVPAPLALAVAGIESNFRQYNKSGSVLTPNDPRSHAMGIFQLQPGTAKEMGVDPTNAAGNILGGLRYLKQLLDRYHGDAEKALEHYYGSKDSAANAAYAHKVLNLEAHYETNVTVNASSGADANKIAAASKKAHESVGREIQRNIAEFLTYSWQQ